MLSCSRCGQPPGLLVKALDPLSICQVFASLIFTSFAINLFFYLLLIFYH